MGCGIGKDCKRCGNQLNHDDGFNEDETLCNKCEKIIEYDKKNLQVELTNFWHFLHREE